METGGGKGKCLWLVMIISFVLDGLMFRWFVSHQFTIVSSSSSMIGYDVTCGCSIMMVLSSYFKISSDSSDLQREKNGWYTLNPEGLPVDVATLLHDILEHLTICCLWSKKLLTHEMTLLLIFRSTMAVTRVGGSIVLNALLKSINNALR